MRDVAAVGLFGVLAFACSGTSDPEKRPDVPVDDRDIRFDHPGPPDCRDLRLRIADLRTACGITGPVSSGATIDVACGFNNTLRYPKQRGLLVMLDDHGGYRTTIKSLVNANHVADLGDDAQIGEIKAMTGARVLYVSREKWMLTFINQPDDQGVRLCDDTQLATLAKLALGRLPTK